VILTFAVIGGLLAGLGRARLRKAPFRVPKLELAWLVAFAFLLQFIAFQLSRTREFIPEKMSAGILVISLVLLLIFIWRNRRLPGGRVLGLGLAANLLVIAMNGGLMPISPETVAKLVPDAPADAWMLGSRLWDGKDIVLSIADTSLWELSDRFLMPSWFPYQIAFSLGDVLIAIGAFWMLWSLGAKQNVALVMDKQGNSPFKLYARR